MRPDLARYLGFSLLVTAAYVVTGKLGLLLAIPPGYATAVWPPSGIALGALLLLGRRYWPAVWLGSFLTNLGMSFGPMGLEMQAASAGPAVMLGTGAALQAVTGTMLVRRFVGFPSALLREREILLFFALGGPLACLIAPSVGTATLLLFGRIGADVAAYSWWTWWVGDTMGASIFAPLVVVWFGGDAWKARRLAVTVSLVVTFTAAVLVFIYTSRLEWQQLEQRVQEDATEIVSAVDRRLELNVERTRAAAGLFSASIDVERPEFREFARFLLGPSSDLQAIQWAPRIRHAQRASFESSLAPIQPQHPWIFELSRHERVRAEEREEYFPVDYVEPLAVNVAAIGYDLASDPERRRALERARDSGKPAASGSVELVQANGTHDGFLIFLPLYRKGMSADPSTEERREQLLGFVVTVIRAHRLVALAASGRPAAKQLQVLVRDAEKPELVLFDSAGETPTAGQKAVLPLWYRTTLQVSGRTWVLTFRPTSLFLAGRDNLLAWTVLAGGLFFTALVGAGTMVLTGRTAAVAAQVREGTAELAQTNERLARADRVKSEFISTVSHELRTPLTSIRGSLGLLNGGAAGALPPKVGELIGIAYRNTDRLQRLINDILDVEKLDSGKLSLELEDQSLPALVAQAVEANAGYAQDCDVRFAIQQPLPEATVRVDPHRLLQVMANLLSNAAKFSPAGTAVEISVQVDGRKARVGVKDQGPGIPPEFQPRIFQRFAQADGSDARLKSGTGLGLAISKALIERMGGRIDYATAPGAGTLFFFDLPLVAL